MQNSSTIVSRSIERKNAEAEKWNRTGGWHEPTSLYEVSNRVAEPLVKCFWFEALPNLVSNLIQGNISKYSVQHEIQLHVRQFLNYANDEH